jgi:Zn2+/Cd2+-exporting ATPase
MTSQHIISPERRALNPVLADDALMLVDGGTEAVFYTPLAQRIAERLDLIIGGGAGVFLLLAWMLSLISGPAPLVHLFTLFAFAIAGIPALTSVWEKLSVFRIDIDLLMLLGALLAAWIGSPFEGALLLFLFALSGAMETYALQRTQSAIVALRDMAPTEATVLKDGRSVRVALRYINVGDRVLIRPGERVPIDGEVVEGQSSLNEAAITGESTPRDCAAGDEVFAGTQNLNGRLEVRVTKFAADTTLSRIVELVTKARHHPSRTQRLVDRIGPTYSIAVIVGSILVGVVNALVFGVEGSESVRRGIAALIVASPCALIIATPVAYLSAITAAARRGVLIKGGSYLEAIAKAGAIVFDKTGTLTSGRLRLMDVVTWDKADESEVIRIAGALEGSSNHPLATAVNEALRERSLHPYDVSAYESIPGEGVRGVVHGKSVWIGRPELIGKYAGASLDAVMSGIARLRDQGKTVSGMVIDNSVTLLAFQDTLRPGLEDTLAKLRRQGVRHMEMLTGDHDIIARRVADMLGLDAYQAELAPEEKLAAADKIRSRYGPVVLVGDGINDAPALAHADAGVAMGSMGADIAMDAAHIVLMKDRIELVAWLHKHALRTARIVRQNLTVAIAVMGVLSLFAATGNIPLPLAVVGHEGSTVLVAINALRLLRSNQ